MPAALYRSVGASGKNHGQRAMVVFVAVAHAAAVEHERMVEQTSVAVRSGLEFAEEVGQHAVVIGIEFGELVHVCPDIRMMRQVVEAVADVGRRINGAADLVS